MGAWGCGNFENDYALDWVADLKEHGDLSFVHNTFDEILEAADDFPEAPECSAALAAAEVLAALNGMPSSCVPDEVEDWITQKRRPNAKLISKAQKAIEVVRTNSELKELWEESGDLQKWQVVVNELYSRLQ